MLLGGRRLAEVVGCIGEILPHEGECALEAVLLAITALGAAPGLLEF